MENSLIPWSYIRFNAVPSSITPKEFKTVALKFAATTVVATSTASTGSTANKASTTSTTPSPTPTPIGSEIVTFFKDKNTINEIIGETIEKSEKGIDDFFTKYSGIPLDLIVFPESDYNLLVRAAEHLTKRWGEDEQTDGFLICPIATSALDVAVEAHRDGKGGTLNSPYIGLIPYPAEENPFKWAGCFAAALARELSNDPSCPLKCFEIDGITKVKEFIPKTKREAYAKFGAFTWVRLQSGNIELENAITTKTRGIKDIPDDSYRFLNTVATLSYLRYDLRNFLLKKYARYKLARDGAIFGRDQKITTPALLKLDLVDKLREWEQRGFLASTTEAIKKIAVKQSLTNPNAIVISMDPELIKQLRITDITMNFS